MDLYSGVAGVVWSAVLLREMLREDWPLDAAADALVHLRTLRSQVDGVPAWRIDPGRDAVYFGAAHGSAGVALALARWGRAAGDAAAVDEARETWAAIARHARTADGEALRVGPAESRHHAVGNWCHGVAGYLWAVLDGVGDDAALHARDRLGRAAARARPGGGHADLLSRPGRAARAVADAAGGAALRGARPPAMRTAPRARCAACT